MRFVYVRLTQRSTREAESNLRDARDGVPVDVERGHVRLSHRALSRFATEAMSGVLRDADGLGGTVDLHLHFDDDRRLIDLLRIGLGGEGATLEASDVDEPRGARPIDLRRDGAGAGAGAARHTRRNRERVVDGLLVRA